MLKLRLILILLMAACFSLATYLHSKQSTLMPSGGRGESFLAVALGDGRKMFANEIFAKADAYFHRGKYPSIFDRETDREDDHMTAETRDESDPGQCGVAGCTHDHHAHDDHDDHNEAGHGEKEGHGKRGVNWIERFGQNFRPNTHLHLGQGEEREMLPWLRLSAELDPQNVQTYTVAAYWLRERIGKVDEAERFLRDGLRANPNHPELLSELARLLFQNRKDPVRARNLWRVALRRWHEVEGPKKEEEQNLLLLQRILGGVAELEIQEGRIPEAIDYFKQLKEVSPSPEAVQERINSLTEQLANPGAALPR